MTKHDHSTPIGESSARIKALQAAMRQIEKDFGQGSVMFLGQQPTEPIEVIPTGSMALNAALGIGGYPRGRIVEIYGGEASGKTTLALHAIAEVQRTGGTALFVDAEHAFDPHYAARLGVDVKALLVAQPDSGEDALEITDTLIRSAAIDLVVVDSVAALTPKAELEGEMGDNKLGLQARLMSQALRKITASLAKTRTTCLFINQLREKNQRHLWQSRSDHRRKRPQVLRFSPTRCAPIQQYQERRLRHRCNDARESGEKQDGAAFPLLRI